MGSKPVAHPLILLLAWMKSTRTTGPLALDLPGKAWNGQQACSPLTLRIIFERIIFEISCAALCPIILDQFSARQAWMAPPYRPSVQRRRHQLRRRRSGSGSIGSTPTGRRGSGDCGLPTRMQSPAAAAPLWHPLRQQRVNANRPRPIRLGFGAGSGPGGARFGSGGALFGSGGA